MKKGDEFLTEEEREWSVKDVNEKIQEAEKSDNYEDKTHKALYLRQLNLIKRIKQVQERKELEDKIRQKLGVKYVSGKFYPEDVAKVLGVNKRQAMVLEKKAIAKLKSPKLGKRLRNVFYE